MDAPNPNLVNEKPLVWQDLWNDMKANFYAESDKWSPTDETMFWNQLEVLPPRAQRDNAFLVGEAWRDHPKWGGPVYACFRECPGKKFEARYLTLRQFVEIFGGIN